MFNSEESFMTAPSTPETQHPWMLPPSLLIQPTFLCFPSHCLQHFKFPLSLIIMVDHIIIDIIWNQFMSQEAVLIIQMEVPDHLLSLYRSRINNRHDKHHTSKEDTCFKKCTLELLLEDIHLCWIWNLWTRMGVILWSFILLGTGTILSSWTLFHFNTTLCTCALPPSFSLVITHSCLLCYL